MLNSYFILDFRISCGKFCPIKIFLFCWSILSIQKCTQMTQVHNFLEHVVWFHELPQSEQVSGHHPGLSQHSRRPSSSCLPILPSHNLVWSIFKLYIHRISWHIFFIFPGFFCSTFLWDSSMFFHTEGGHLFSLLRDFSKAWTNYLFTWITIDGCWWIRIISVFYYWK